MSGTGTSPTRLSRDVDMSIIEDVRQAVIAIPAGFVASYGDIGKSARGNNGWLDDAIIKKPA